jgi:hypothetical protein
MRVLHVVVNWGLPTRFLYVVSALKAQDVHAWWFHADTDVAHTVFLARGGIDSRFFEQQMADINREWLLIRSVFEPRIVETLRSDLSWLQAPDIWQQMRIA